MSTNERLSGKGTKLFSFQEAIKKMQGLGVDLSPLWADLLCLDRLAWKIPINRNHSSQFLIGNVQNQAFNFQGDADILNALAVISIAKEGSATSIAGVVNGNRDKRIVSATYGKSGELMKLIVSIPYEEQLDLSENMNGADMASVLAEFPKTTATQQITTDLITTGMYKSVNGLDNGITGKRHTPHVGAIIFGFNGDKSRILPGLLAGYRNERTGKEVTVGLPKDAAERRGLTSWNITVPLSLPKA